MVALCGSAVLVVEPVFSDLDRRKSVPEESPVEALDAYDEDEVQNQKAAR